MPGRRIKIMLKLRCKKCNVLCTTEFTYEITGTVPLNKKCKGVFATSANFLIPISPQPDDVKL